MRNKNGLEGDGSVICWGCHYHGVSHLVFRWLLFIHPVVGRPGHECNALTTWGSDAGSQLQRNQHGAEQRLSNHCLRPVNVNAGQSSASFILFLFWDFLTSHLLLMSYSLCGFFQHFQPSQGNIFSTKGAFAAAKTSRSWMDDSIDVDHLTDIQPTPKVDIHGAVVTWGHPGTGC